MPRIRAFQGIRYNTETVTITNALCPPYDVISPLQVDQYYKKDPYNAIRLVLGKQFPKDTRGDNRYTRARDFFKQWLDENQKTAQYQQLLEKSFNPDTLDKLMCRHQVCIGWDGLIYDCDFNFALKLPIGNMPKHLRQFDSASHKAREIVTGPHCFGCTAGKGSSCAGALQ